MNANRTRDMSDRSAIRCAADGCTDQIFDVDAARSSAQRGIAVLCLLMVCLAGSLGATHALAASNHQAASQAAASQAVATQLNDAEAPNADRIERPSDVTRSEIAPDGWSANSINATIFRQNAVVSHGDWQVAGYYNNEGQVILAHRTLPDGEWTLHNTGLTGNVRDAHNGVNLGIDGSGVLHIAWDHHGHPLHYARGVEPESVELAPPGAMLGEHESNVTYPQFLTLPDGRLMFLYRDGSSGNGNLVVNRLDPETQTWSRLHDVLIDGQGQRNAYWQAAVDARGSLHVSWVWRESWDVATNHDLAYAVSHDGGESWQRSDGADYAIPIRQETAEVVCDIPQRRELINQTSMAADAAGRACIVTYYRPSEHQPPQVHLIQQTDQGWEFHQVSRRTETFSLSGGGTKRIPISRPQIALGPVTQDEDGQFSDPDIHVIYRDNARGGGVTVASRRSRDIGESDWNIREIFDQNLGQWEPAYDRSAWRDRGELHLFIQSVQQVDGEGLGEVTATPVSILEWRPEFSADD